MSHSKSAALAFVSLAVLAAPALAVQDTPTTINGVETVCTGVGSAKDDPRWAGYPVKLVIANTSGQNLAAMQITLTQGGKPVVQTSCDAPWVLFKLPPGQYKASASSATAGTQSADFKTSGSGAQQEITIMFNTPPNQ